MQKNLIPTLVILSVAAILITINELIDFSFIKDYALILIISSMLFGAWLVRMSDRSKRNKNKHEI